MGQQIQSTPITIDNYNPHTGQRDFHNSSARYRILACGRRWGKDYCTIHEAIKYCFPNRSLVWWVAPQYSQTRIGWDMALQFINMELVKNVNRSDYYIEFINGSQLWFKSADNPDALRGRGIDFLVLDEAALIKRDCWEHALRPALSDTLGHVVFIGTPKGYNWFHEVWVRGNDPQESEWKSWTHPTTENPYISKSEIDEVRKTLPDKVFQQEFEAIFIEGEGTVFRKIQDCIQGTLEPPQPNIPYVVGADLAKHQDCSVYIVARQDTGHIVAFDRTSKIDWHFQRNRLVNLCQQYNNARLLIDSSGVGDPVYDELRREQVHVEGYKTGVHAAKVAMIENLILMIENRQITIPGTPPIYDDNGKLITQGVCSIPEMQQELEIYGYEITPSGTTTYQAPQGYHDDIVVSLALTAWQLRRSGPLAVSGVNVPW